MERIEFEEGPIDGVVIRPLTRHEDGRGWLIELYREDELPSPLHPCMAYLSETLPGVVRGPHAHREQTDYFAFVGPGEFELYLWDARESSHTFRHRQTISAGESHPTAIAVPPGVVHAYKAIGKVPGWVFNAANRLYAGQGRQEAVDEIRYENLVDSPFTID